MKLVVDTNVLVRFFVEDDPEQAAQAADALKAAESIVLSPLVLCELTWVLRRRYEASNDDIISAIRGLLESDGIETNRPAAESGLRMLENGGDFADGVILYEAQQARTDALVTFDRRFAGRDWSGTVRLLD